MRDRQSQDQDNRERNKSVNQDVSEHIRKVLKRKKRNKHLYKALRGVNRTFAKRYYDWINRLNINALSKVKFHKNDGELTKRAFNTLRSYVNRSIYFLEFLNGIEKHPFTFDASDALKFQEYMQKRDKTFNGIPMTNQYINQIFDAIRNMYDYFVVVGAGSKVMDDDGNIKVVKIWQNPFKLVPNLPQAVESVERRLTDEQLQILFNVAQKEMKAESHYIVALLLGVYSGLRISEATTIKKEDIVKKEYEGETRLTIHILGKGMKKRETIYIDEDSTKNIEEYVKSLNNGDKLIPTTTEALLKFCYRLGKKLNFPFSYHKLRHTFGYELARKNVSIETIAKLLGHSSLDTTRIYSKVTIERAMGEVF